MKANWAGITSWMAILAAAVLVTGGIARGQRSPRPLSRVDLGAVSVQLSSFHQSPDAQMIRAFIATGSESPVVLATANRCSDPFMDISYTCSRVTYNGESGVLVLVNAHSAQLPVTGFNVTMTIYQEGAVKYDPPIHYLDPVFAD